MGEPQPSTRLENRLIARMDLITRAPICEQSCKELIAYLKQTDISYLQFFILVAHRYFDTAFTFWEKYQRNLGACISQFMNLLYSKINFAKLQSLKIAFQSLKSKYERSTKKRVTLLPAGQFSIFDTDEKYKQYVQRLDKRKTEEQEKEKVPNGQKADSVINVNKDLGANHLESRIEPFKQMYYKARLMHATTAQRQLQSKLVEKLEKTLLDEMNLRREIEQKKVIQTQKQFTQINQKGNQLIDTQKGDHIIVLMANQQHRTTRKARNPNRKVPLLTLRENNSRTENN